MVLAACGGGNDNSQVSVAADTIKPTASAPAPAPAPAPVPASAPAPVIPINHAPTFASANISLSVTLDLKPVVISLPYAKDIDSGDTLIYTVSNLPTGVTYDPSTRSISISPTTTPNTYTLGLVATDKSRASASMTVSLQIVFDPAPVAGGAFAALTNMTVSDNSGNPGIGGVPSIIINAGGVTDTLGRTIIYSATGLPKGLSINSGTGVISGIYDVNGVASENFTTTITAKATGSGQSLSKTFILTIRNDG